MAHMLRSIWRLLGPLQTIWADIWIGRRMLARTPGFTAVAAGTIALGIGANVLIFSVVNTVLLRPLPYRDPDRLVRLGRSPDDWAIVPDYDDWRSQKQVFQEVAAIRAIDRDARCTVAEGDEREVVPCAKVSASLFPLLGIRPLLGRPIAQEEDRFGGDKVAVLSYRFFQRQFGGDQRVVGRRVVIDAEACTIIGVMPQGFVFPSRDDDFDLLKPLAAPVQDRNSRLEGVEVIARLRPEVSLERAKAVMDVLQARLAPSDQFKKHEPTIRPLRADVVQYARTPLLILLGAVGLVLLIACANVANLLLARGATRRKEIAIRLSLGAGRGRVLRQLLIESALLSLTGGALGLALAYFGLDPIKALAPVRIPLLFSASIDAWVLAFTLVVSLANGLLAGLAPALAMSRLDLTPHLKEGMGGASSPVLYRRARAALVVAELSLAMILVAGASLLVKSLWLLARTDSGFDTRTAITMDMDTGWTPMAERTAFVEAVLERIAALPGVKASGVLEGLGNDDAFTIPGQAPVRREDTPRADVQFASPGLFRASGMRLVAGRFFGPQDAETGPPVAIINQALARRYFSGQDPIGREIQAGVGCVSCHVDPSGQDPVGRQIRRAAAGWPLSGPGRTGRVIVGVVGNVRTHGLDVEPKPEIYLPFAQTKILGHGVHVRALGGTPAALRAAVGEVDSTAVVFPPQTIEEKLSGSIAPRRVNAIFLGSFAALALLLAAVGVYGVLSYTVSVRTHEFGVRMALGARSADLTRMVLREAAALIAVGLAVGLIGALALTRLLRTLLYGVAASDAFSFLAAAAVLAGVALAASYLPAWRAARVEPLSALRSE